MRSARSLVVSVVVAAGVLAIGLGSAGATPGQKARTVSVKLTDAGCDPPQLSLTAGPVTFQVTNDGAEAVSEFEILSGGHLLGEVENLAPGLSGSFSLTLKPGVYTMYCPGGTTAERGVLTVTGGQEVGQGSAQAKAAVARYRSYVEQQTALLVTRTRAFVQALRTGNVALAKKRYEAARVPYERVEPVAESFGALDPAIDARAGDIPAAQWTGFHPIEQKLWVKRTTAGTSRLARKLLADVQTLQRRSKTIKLEPAQIANGAVELLGEVSKSKITGEEERYSHIDLVDFQANVDGAQAAFRAVRPILAGRQAGLAGQIDRRFSAVGTALRPYRRGDGYIPYTKLTSRDTRLLSQAIDALAEPLSKVAAIVVAAR
jgi:iron uptake system component EfeO